MGAWISSIFESFLGTTMEIAVVGLDNAGKSTLVSGLMSGTGRPTVSDPLPTIGLSVNTFKKGSVTIKAWDLAGQEACRAAWGRYTKGVDIILFVVDVTDEARLGDARRELHRLLEDRALATTPLLIAANKIDVTPHISERDLITGLNLDCIMEQPWVVVPVSAKFGSNVEAVMDWLIKQKKGEAAAAAATATRSGGIIGGGGSGAAGGAGGAPVGGIGYGSAAGGLA